MKYGDLVLSEDKSMVRYYVTDDESQKREQLTFLRVATFIFQRPDTKSMILELDGQLMESQPNLVRKLNLPNVAYFRELISVNYDKELDGEMAEYSRLTILKETIQEKVHDLQRSIEVINEKNRVEHSENREKSIRGLEKAMRKHGVRIKGLEQQLDKQTIIIKKLENECQRSLVQVDKDMSLYLN